MLIFYFFLEFKGKKDFLMLKTNFHHFPLEKERNDMTPKPNIPSINLDDPHALDKYLNEEKS